MSQTILDFGSLLGAQVVALLEAEVLGAQKTADYIDSVAFRSENGKQVLNMVAFDMVRRDAGIPKTYTVQVPALTLVPIPMLSIQEATLDFHLQVEDTPPAARPAPKGLGQAIISALPPLNRLQTRLARTDGPGTSSKADLKVSVKLTQSPLPAGIERLLNVADLAVTDEQHTEPKPDEPVT